MVSVSCHYTMPFWVHIHLNVCFLLINFCFLLINVCGSQIHVIDSDVTEKLSKCKTSFQNISGESILCETEPQFYRLVLNGNVLHVGGRESLDTINLTSWSVSRHVPFRTSSSMTCRSKNLLDGILCYNYVTIIEPKDGCLFVCGTDAMSPKCYFVNQLGELAPDNSYVDENIAPKDPKQNCTWLNVAADDKCFSATGMPVDRSGDPGFLRANLSRCYDSFTEGLSQFNSLKWLNVPHFVGESIEKDGYIYFFFREFATEHINAGRVMHSRVARVCKTDSGGKPFTDFGDKFITYQKARLSCSTSKGAGKDSNFMYNDIQDVYYDTVSTLVYAVFTTPQPGPTSSALCVYSMSDIVHVFETSKYWGTSNPEFLWSTPASSDVPNPRPGQCGVTYPIDDETFRLFLVNYPLLEKLVEPTLTVVQDDVRYVQVMVGEVNDQTLMFLGTYQNSIIKAAFNGSAIEMIEEIDLSLDGVPQSPVLNIIKDDALKSLYISTEFSVYKLPLMTSYPDIGSCKATIEAGAEKTEMAYTTKDEIKNVNFIVSARSNLNLSATDVICDNCKPMNECSKTSVDGDREFLISMYSVKVRENCTCAVTFTADCAENINWRTEFKVDGSCRVPDDNCVKRVQDYDNKLIRYKYDLQRWKNDLIQNSSCVQTTCRAQTAYLDDPFYSQCQ